MIKHPKSRKGKVKAQSKGSKGPTVKEHQRSRENKVKAQRTEGQTYGGDRAPKPREQR